MSFHYATQLYRPADDACFERLLSGIRLNLDLPGLQRATIFLDGCDPPWTHHLVTWLPLQQRASFGDFLALANNHYIEKPEHLLFANSDIVFDKDIIRLVKALQQPNWAICLTRRELDGSFPPGVEPLQTQDAWLLAHQPLPPLLINQLRGVFLGVPGCEHLYATALVSNGYRLWNPCEDFQALHTDPSPGNHAPVGERYWGLYTYLPPCHLADVGATDPGVFFSFAQAPGNYYCANMSQTGA